MPRQVYSAEALADSSPNGGTTPATRVTLTFTPDASSDYLILWSCDASIATSSVDFRVDLHDGTTVLGESRYEPSTTGTGKFHSCGGIYRHQEGASPVSRSFSIRYYAESATNNVIIRNARIVAIKLTANDVWKETAGPTTTTSATYSTLDTLSVTPATDGDYLVIANWQIRSNSTTNSAKARLLVDGATAVDEWIGVAQNETASQEIPLVMVRRFTWDATPHTVALQHCTETSTPTVSSQRMRAVALRLDDGWVGAVYDAQDTRVTQVGSTGAWTTRNSLPAIHNRQPTLFAWRAEIDTTTTGQDVRVRGRCGCGTVITETNFRMANGQRHISFGFGLITPGAYGPALPALIEYHADTGATAGLRNATIAVLNPGEVITCLQGTRLDDADVLPIHTSAARAEVEATCTAGATTDYLNEPQCIATAEATVRIGASPSAEEVRDAVLDGLIEGTISLRQSQRLLLSVAAGDAAGLDGNPSFQSLDGSKTRVAGTRSGGARTITTRDGT